MTAVELAPILRGVLIEKAGGPWVAASLAEKADGDVLVINGTAENAGTSIAQTIRELTTIPCRVCIRLERGEHHFITAPDLEGLEKIRRNEKNGPWEIPVPETGIQALRAAAARRRVALVTGGAQGFGEEIVRGLIDAGAQVFIADLNGEGAQKLAAALNAETGKSIARAVTVNVADEASVMAMTDLIARTAGGLDLCISNAGVLRAQSILEQDIDSFKFVTGINYTAFAIVTKHCGLLMKSQNLCAPSWTTDIIQINSKSGLEGSNKNGSYAGSKFGGIGLVQSFAKELVEYRIKVNAVCPGNFYEGPLWSDPEKGLFVQYLKTGKVPGAKTLADIKAFYEAKVPMHRGCTGPDVLRAILYLIEQIYETGQALPVTGGQVMMH